jgi:hypothetical protein
MVMVPAGRLVTVEASGPIAALPPQAGHPNGILHGQPTKQIGHPRRMP